jgi:hypothetical protein
MIFSSYTACNKKLKEAWVRPPFFYTIAIREKGKVKNDLILMVFILVV